jgi:hypothetical protein
MWIDSQYQSGPLIIVWGRMTSRLQSSRLCIRWFDLDPQSFFRFMIIAGVVSVSAFLAVRVSVRFLLAILGIDALLILSRRPRSDW